MSYFYTCAQQAGNRIFFSGYANGKRFFDDVEYKPTLWVKGPGNFRTLDGVPVQAKKFDSIRDARDFVKRYSEVENFPFYGMTNYVYPFLNEEFPNEIEYDLSLISVVTVDIETLSVDGKFAKPETAEGPIPAITLVKGERTITLGTKYFKPTDPNHEYILCTDERDLLARFLDVWKELAPDVVTGWNIDLYDIPYIINRLNRVLGEKLTKTLSPWNMINQREIVRAKLSTTISKDPADRTDVVYEIVGVASLDYLQLYKKFSLETQESYRLDNIAYVELKERKLDYSNFDSLDDLYEKDPERYYQYNAHDTKLVQRLENKLGYIKQIIALAYRAKINYTDAFTTTKPWDVIIHNHLLAKGVVIPQQERRVDRRIVGAYVHEPQVGMHQYVVTFDFKSLYPTIISQNNISPETFFRNGYDFGTIDSVLKSRHIDGSYLRQVDGSLTANGCIFNRNRRGFIPELVDLFISERDDIKKKMISLQKDNEVKKSEELTRQIGQLHSREQSYKILANSLYGSLANQHFRWFDPDLAEAVTMTGQLFIKWVMLHVNEYLNRILKTDGIDFVVAGDTDSIIVCLHKLVDVMKITDTQKAIDFLDNVCKQKLEPLIQKACEDLCNQLNVYKNVMVMKREVIADKAVWRKMKNYAMNVWDKEGVRYKEPKIVVKGLEIVRSSTPFKIRDKLKEAVKIILQKDQSTLQSFVAEFSSEFKNLTYEDIAFPRGCNGIMDWYDPVQICKKSTPIHVRGAIIYNEFLKKQGLTGRYQSISDGAKIRFIYLKQPNPLMSHVIAWPDEGTIPKQLDVLPYIDRDLQWEKTFLQPLKSITDVIKWDLEKRTSVEAFFA